jgi:Domain of unknown function (DUF1772)
MLLLQVVAIFLVSGAMGLALAHALEYPGKMRLDRENYTTVQGIYYPRFTIGGGLGEGVGFLATLVLLLLTPRGDPVFWWTVAALIALVGMQAVYWAVTHPVNRFWVDRLPLAKAGRSFFDAGRGTQSTVIEHEDQWTRLRRTWEYSHMLRAALAGISFISLTIAVATYGRI